ncbi:MAG: DMT family transporter [Bacteroidales bacterium]
MNEKSEQIINWLMLIFLSLIWGSSFILMKYGLRSFSYGQVAGFRMFIAFIALLPVALYHIRKVTKKNFLSLVIVGFIGNAIPAFLFTLAETRIESAMAGILNSMTPFFTMIIGAVIYRVKIRWISLAGVFIGLGGAIAVITSNTDDITGKINAFALFVVLATIMYGININHVKSKLNELNGIQIASFAFLMVGPAVTTYLLSTGLQETFSQENAWNDFLYVFLLGFFGSAVAVVMVNILIQRSNALFASSVTYMMPIVAIIWGIIDGEKLSITQYAGMAFILLGVYLVNKRKHKLR